ncbi:hypothetical protein JL107_01320 [Nakamurella flavida]|uniref:Uncharacterized protein n=1 Tax=Nakamurella flavida TaxID=363630 RepID=A0A938YLF4_9ACTN|nr:hypothetical protein [Nakamurella flavida]MBM9475075.1 hypothetical protein [Nakamurella flavida]MDP9776644.1 hypothetical protein [Nakamurella flavida]
MAPISDPAVVDLLSRVDALWGPVVRRLGRPPEELPAGQRAKWWADTVSRFAAVVSATPRFAGKFADLLPLQDGVGAAVQSLVVLGVAHEHGLTGPTGRDRAERVALLAQVLLDKPLTADEVESLQGKGLGVYVEEAFGPAEDRSGASGVVKTVLRVAGTLGRVGDLLDDRPKGGRLARLVSIVPVVGVVGGYLAEHEGLRKAAKETQRRLKADPPRASAAQTVDA